MKIVKKLVLVLALIMAAMISITNITPLTVSVDNHTHSINQIDEKITTVMELTAGATAASAVLSLLPDDTCTPVAQQLAEFGTYFLVVLSALYLEKYLVTSVGFISFSILIPLACLALGVGILAKKDIFKALAAKLLICSLAIYLVVPFSVKISDIIYQNYEASIEDTISEAVEIGENKESSGIMSQITEWIKASSEKAVDYVSGVLSNFIEALAVMIVTSCLIPILVIMFIVGLVKVLFGISSPTQIKFSPKFICSEKEDIEIVEE